MVLLRREVGDVLRAHRKDSGRTLRDVSGEAAVSLGYLSEVERGEKEASSEMLNAICTALGLPLADMLAGVSDRVARAEATAQPVALPIGRGHLDHVRASAA